MKGQFLMNWLQQRARTHPQRPVFRNGNEIYTYQKFFQESCQLSKILKNRGIRKGDRVAVLGLNSFFHLLCGFAAWQLGAILVPLNFRLSRAELQPVLKDAAPAITFVDEKHKDLVPGISFEEIVREAASQADSTDIPSEKYPVEETAMILYTSGTTGIPKGVLLSHKMLLANIQNTVDGWGLTEDDRSLLFAPLFHTGGWNVLTLPLLHCGGHSILMPSFDALQVLEYIKAGEVTVLFGVPTMFEMMLKSWDVSPSAARKIRFFISGGAPCPKNLIEAYLEKGISFRQGFGMTEVGPNCFYFPPEAVREKMGSVGKPMVLTTMKLMGSEEEGELAIGGDHVFSGYWNNTEATKKTLCDGMVLTGDLARRDRDGFFYIVGRKKDMYISGGENVYPAEIERELQTCPEIEAATVIGILDEKWGEVGCAFIVLKEKASLREEDLKKFLREKLAHYKVPKHYRFVSDLPRNSMGKVQKEELKKMYNG